jgi:hypothetical protein
MMNILIAKSDREFREAHGWRLFHAHFAGHWEGDKFLVRKDRPGNAVGQLLTAEQLSEHLTKITEDA